MLSINFSFRYGLHLIHGQRSVKIRIVKKSSAARSWHGDFREPLFLAQLDVPIGEVNEVLPAIVAVQAEVDLHKRPPLWPLGLANEMQIGFLGGVVGLLRVALDAGANDVFPRRRAAAVARNDVVQIQVLALEYNAAVLAGILVALKDVVAREFDFLLRQTVVNQKQDDSRYADTEGNGVDGLVMGRVAGKVAPFVKIKSAK